jgi:hypothetical protein
MYHSHFFQIIWNMILRWIEMSPHSLDDTLKSKLNEDHKASNELITQNSVATGKMKNLNETKSESKVLETVVDITSIVKIEDVIEDNPLNPFESITSRSGRFLLFFVSLSLSLTHKHALNTHSLIHSFTHSLRSVWMFLSPFENKIITEIAIQF